MGFQGGIGAAEAQAGSRLLPCGCFWGVLPFAVPRLEGASGAGERMSSQRAIWRLLGAGTEARTRGPGLGVR